MAMCVLVDYIEARGPQCMAEKGGVYRVSLTRGKTCDKTRPSRAFGWAAMCGQAFSACSEWGNDLFGSTAHLPRWASTVPHRLSGIF